jgi:hypothetical protein
MIKSSTKKKNHDKSVFQATLMSIFLIPSSEIEKRMNSFWWVIIITGQRVNWLSWERLAMHKNVGGLEFKKSCL